MSATRLIYEQTYVTFKEHGIDDDFFHAVWSKYQSLSQSKSTVVGATEQTFDDEPTLASPPCKGRCTTASGTDGQSDDLRVADGRQSSKEPLVKAPVEYFCQFPGCTYKTGRTNNLERHQITHSTNEQLEKDGKLFYCFECTPPKVYRRKQELMTHARAKHGAAAALLRPGRSSRKKTK